MRELTKSVFSFSWAMSMFGVKQMTAMLTPPSGWSSATTAFDAVTRSAEQQLGDATRSTFQAGDNMQRSLLDVLFSFWNVGAWNPDQILRASAEVVQRTAQAGAAAVQSTVEAAGKVAQGATGWALSRLASGGGWGPIPKADCGC